MAVPSSTVSALSRSQAGFTSMYKSCLRHQRNPPWSHRFGLISGMIGETESRGQTMQDKSIEARRDQVVASLKSVRETYEKCLRDASAEVGNRGSEWSIADLLRHTNGEGYPNRIRRMLEEDSPKLPGFDREGAWRQLVEATLARIDQALDWATTLTSDHLNRPGERGGQAVTVIGYLEAHTTHFEEHLAQLRDEIRPREGLRAV